MAESLKVLQAQVNNIAPSSSRKNDGTIGDDTHQQTDSDHNPWIFDLKLNVGVVTAMDVAHDPVNNCDCDKIANATQKDKDDRVNTLFGTDRL